MSIAKDADAPITLTKTATIAQGAKLSGWISIPPWATFAGAIFPDMDAGDVGIDMTPDGGTTPAPILKSDGSGDAVVCASGADPGYTDISDYIRALPSYNNPNHPVYIRFNSATTQSSAEVAIDVLFME